MGSYCSNLVLFLLFISWGFFISNSNQLQATQTQLLIQLRKHLEYPLQLSNWENFNGDFCNLDSNPQVTIKCEGNSVIELKIMGDKLSKVSDFHGYAIKNQTLSESFSIDSLVVTLARLNTLRVLSLVSLGIWGPLPDKIHRLSSSLELLDLSSNFIFGSIPDEVSRLVKLHTLTLDGNFFNESIPIWLDSMSNLTILSLKNNRLKGEFSFSISKITTLTDIALSHNNLTGELPDLSALSALHLLDLRENGFDSELPLLPRGVTTVLLSKNLLKGRIPKEFGELDRLQHLDLSYNSLVGSPPFGLFSLPNISYLNLASNLLSGSLHDIKKCGDNLGFVDISSNGLTGRLPSCLDTNSSNKRVVKFSGNCLFGGNQQMSLDSICKEVSVKKKRSWGSAVWIVIGVVGLVVIFLVIIAFVRLFFRKRHHQREIITLQHTVPKVIQDSLPSGISSEVLANARVISEASKLGTQGAPSSRVFSMEDLAGATDNFSSSVFLGEGSIGKLYKGKLENGSCIVIRSLSLFKKYSIRNLKVRLDLLAKLRHPHLVGFLGYCINEEGLEDSTSSRVFLVHEYISNGNFRSHLSESSPNHVLKWSDRLAILIGIAKAVHFLHTGVIPASSSNRLRTNNILLDEHRIAKLSDYGMSIITEELEQFEAKGDGPKSWHMKKLADDVYDFGFILLEALVGPIVTGKGESFLLNEMKSFGSQDGRQRIVDPMVLTTCSQESLTIVISITNKCISPEPGNRPSFEDVLWNLQYAAQVQATADSEQKSDGAF